MTKTFSHLLILKNGGYVLYGDNNNSKILGFSTIGKNFNPTIKDVLFVEGLKYNLLSLSQLCDKGNEMLFDSFICRVNKI